MDLKLDINFVSGGYTRCGDWWTMKAAAIDLCFKLYYVAAGGARMQFGDEICDLAGGKIYLINGFKLSRQRCDEYMDVYWIHFTTEGINPRVVSSLLPAFFSWPQSAANGFSEAVGDIFEEKKTALAGIAADCRIRSVVNSLLAELLGQCSEKDFHIWAAAFGRINTAIEYMDAHYTDNPPLDTVAAIANYAPNYFHRAFKNIIGITPYEYMLKKRLNKAKQLLTASDLPISQIAELTGYENSYYFSRAFRKNTGKTPSQVRRNSPV